MPNEPTDITAVIADSHLVDRIANGDDVDADADDAVTRLLTTMRNEARA